MSLAKRGFSAAVYSFIAQIATKVLNFLSAFFVISLLTVEEYGIFSLFQAVFVFFLSLSFGVPKIINRYYPEYEEKEDWYIIKRILLFSFLLRGLVVAVSSIILYIYRESFLEIFNIPASYSKSIYFFCIYVFVYSLSHTFECILLSQMQYKFKQLFQLVLHLFQICSIYYVLINGYGIHGIILIWLISNLIKLIAFSMKSLYRILDKIKNTKKKKPFPFKRISRYGGLYFASTIGGLFLHFSTDIFFVSYYSGNADAGLYSFGAKISMLALTLSPALALQGIITTLLIRSRARNHYSELISNIRTYYKILLFSNLPILVLAGIFAEDAIIFIFKEDYLDSLVILYGFLFIQIFRMVAIPLHPVIKILEKPEITFGPLIISFIKIFLVIILVPLYGAYGALLSTGLAVAFSSLYIILMLRKDINLSFPWRSFFKFGINTLGLVIVALILKPFVSSFITLILCSAISMISYALFCYFNKGFSDSDRQMFNKAIGRKLFVF